MEAIHSMVSYKDLLDLEDDIDDIIPPSDPLAEAVYNNTKLEYLMKNVNYTSDDGDGDEMGDEMGDDDEVETQMNLGKDLDKGMELSLRDESRVDQEVNDDTSNWKLLRVIAGAHQGWVRCVAVDQVTNKWYATGSSDSMIKIWDLASLKVKATLLGHIMGVRSLAISTKSPYLFSGSEDKTVRCWDLERSNSTAGCEIRKYHGHVGGIYAMALHPELDLLFTGGRDQVVRVWDIRSRAQVMVLTGHRSDISSIVSQAADPQIVSSSMDSTIRLWDLRKQQSSLTITQHAKSIRLMVLHPQEATICSGDSNGNIKQWLLPGGELFDEFADSQKNIINTLSINPANNQLFVGFDNGKLEFRDYDGGKLLQKEQSTVLGESSPSTIYASTFDMSGLRLITCEGDKCIKVWGED